MDNAEVYLLLRRMTGIPVVGEAQPLPFVGQIELTDWSWEISSVEEEERAKNRNAARTNAANRTAGAGGSTPSGGSATAGGAAAAPNTAAANLARNQRTSATQSASRRSAEQTAEDIVDLRSTDAKKTQWDRYSRSDQKSRIKVIVGRALGEVAEAASPDDDASGSGGAEPAAGEEQANQSARERNLTISFGKNVDLASTQMLNSMKGGEIFQTATISVFHRSATTPLLLVINLTKFRFTTYQMSVEQSETETNMKETWGGEFERFDYMYQNRAPAGMPKSASQAAGVAASQGRTLVFVMKPRGLF